MRREANDIKTRNRRRKKTREIQERSLRTRQRLIAAARDVFSRDGFELTKLDDIARLAGKTRGAVYAHFENKEDIFFSIFEDELSRNHCSAAGEAYTSISSSGAICIERRHLARILKDKQRWLLHLELNLYARRIRRPSPRFLRILRQIQMYSPGAEFASIFAAFYAQEGLPVRTRRETVHK
jgi:AcrR family transcriptional regulator